MWKTFHFWLNRCLILLTNVVCSLSPSNHIIYSSSYFWCVLTQEWDRPLNVCFLGNHYRVHFYRDVKTSYCIFFCRITNRARSLLQLIPTDPSIVEALDSVGQKVVNLLSVLGLTAHVFVSVHNNYRFITFFLFIMAFFRQISNNSKLLPLRYVSLWLESTK